MRSKPSTGARPPFPEPKPGQAARRRFIGRVLTVLSSAGQVVGVGGLFLASASFLVLDPPLEFGALPVHVRALWPEAYLDLPVAVLAVPCAVLFGVSEALFRLARRFSAVSYEFADGHAFEAPIVYLRPFSADVVPLGPQSFPVLGAARYEELLAHAFRRLGPVVTVGDPREPLPRLGATRVYVRGDRAAPGAAQAWQDEVTRLIASARLVLLHIGTSEGLRWEVRQAIAHTDPTRLVLCLHPPARRTGGGYARTEELAAVDEAWAAFVAASGHEFPRPLPQAVGDGQFVCFDDHWAPRILRRAHVRLSFMFPGRRRGDGRSDVERALAWLAVALVPEPWGRRTARWLVNRVEALLLFAAAVGAVWAMWALWDVLQQAVRD